MTRFQSCPNRVRPTYAPASHVAPRRHGINLAAQSPLQNRILSMLPAEVYAPLLPLLEPYPLRQGRPVHGAGSPQTHMYFITQGVVSRCCVTTDGHSAEFSSIGNEGVLGVSLCLGGGATLSQAEVIVEGFAFRLRSDRLQSELGKHGPLFALLLRYTHSVLEETGQIGACNRHHRLQQRLCRWLLSLLDRTPDSCLTVTHEQIAIQLGVRRESATQEAGNLRQEGLLFCCRGHTTVLDRRGLETRACECYANVRRAHDCLLPPAGT